jgi:hypothetical protein
MEKSLFENFSDRQLIKYMRYVLPILSEISQDLESFSDELGGEVEKQVAAPIGGSLSRLDKEYLYYLVSKNGNFESESVNRPTLSEMDIQFIVKERIVSYTTHIGELLTYIEDNVDQDYLYHLKNNDEIDPWEWSSDTDYGDSDYIDDEFDY